MLGTSYESELRASKTDYVIMALNRLYKYGDEGHALVERLVEAAIRLCHSGDPDSLREFKNLFRGIKNVDSE
jgi:hypothetical protein